MLSLMLIALLAISCAIWGNPINELVMLIVVSVCVISAVIAIEYLKRKADVLKARKIFELQTNGKMPGKTGRIIIRLLGYVVLAICIYLISKHQIYFGFAVAPILASIIIPGIYLTRNMLVLDYNGIRCPLKWDLKWAKIKSSKIDKKNGVLLVEKTNGQLKQVERIKNEDIDEVREMIERFIS
jgi:hypothetical protein